MNRIALLGFHRSEIVHRLAQHIQHASERRAAHRHRNRFTEVFRIHAAHHALSRLHRHAAHAPFAEMLFNFSYHVARPTGTVIGSPRSSAFMPRTMPSVGFIATQRTRPSPRCCSTSATTSSGSGTLNPSLVIRTAL